VRKAAKGKAANIHPAFGFVSGAWRIARMNKMPTGSKKRGISNSGIGGIVAKKIKNYPRIGVILQISDK